MKFLFIWLGIVQGGSVTDRGSEFDVVTELYSSQELTKQNLIGKLKSFEILCQSSNEGTKSNTFIGRGVSSFLIVKRSKKSEPKVEKEEELPSVTRTTTFRVPANQGVKYAGASGGNVTLIPTTVTAKPQIKQNFLQSRARPLPKNL